MKMWKKILLALLFIVVVLPYLLPSENDRKIAEKPFENSEFVTVDDVSLHYRIWPNAEAKGNILLIHGLGGSTFSFRNNAEVLSQAGYNVVAVDLPAFGYSDRKRNINHSQNNRARLLWLMIDEIEKNNGFTQDWILTGHSMGASTTIAMANQKPDKVSALGFIDGAVSGVHRNSFLFNIPPVQQWMKVILKNFVVSQKNVTEFLTSAYNRMPSEQEISGYLDPYMITGTFGAWADFLASAKNLNIDELVDKDVPILVLWGEDDEWVSVDTVDIITSTVSQTYVYIFEGEGHCPNETSPIFNEKMIEMLNQLP
jgi:2-hydroxy-6-oxonona-2,4-dienedioate hydrolase